MVKGQGLLAVAGAGPGRWSGCPAAGEEMSALRRARLARNWTPEDLVEEMDLRTAGGHSGVTTSTVSGWELRAAGLQQPHPGGQLRRHVQHPLA